MSSEMPWTLMQFTGQALVPYSEHDLKQITDRYAPGAELRAKFFKLRSLPHTRLYWAVLDEIVEATGLWVNVADLHEALKLHLRMVREVRMLNGEIRFVTRSIGFDAMEQGEYRRYFERAMLGIEEWLGINTAELIAIAKAKTAKVGHEAFLKELA